jgi:hypothetical protein
MLTLLLALISLGLPGLSSALAGPDKNDLSVVKPFKVDLSAGVPRMLDLINNTILPDKSEYPGVNSTFGIDLDVLKSLQNQWLHEYDWDKDQSYINRCVRSHFDLLTFCEAREDISNF